MELLAFFFGSMCIWIVFTLDYKFAWPIAIIIALIIFPALASLSYAQYNGWIQVLSLALGGIYGKIVAWVIAHDWIHPYTPIT